MGIIMTINRVKTQWQYLETRPHAWRRQLYVKNTRIKAFDIWSDMIINEMTVQEAALNWELSLATIGEIIDYCETNQTLLQQEAEQERYLLEAKGISLEPKIIVR